MRFSHPCAEMPVTAVVTVRGLFFVTVRQHRGNGEIREKKVSLYLSNTHARVRVFKALRERRGGNFGITNSTVFL